MSSPVSPAEEASLSLSEPCGGGSVVTVLIGGLLLAESSLSLSLSLSSVV
ncbi:MAG: hypothetical protein IPK80_16050 [Nannocystis sp.]|nr:hypothetical protein [Nannocystis sp.]